MTFSRLPLVAPLALSLAFAGCGADQGTVAPPPASPPAPMPAPAAPPPVAAAPTATPAAATPPPSYEQQYRQLLEQMVSVDTSHGHETALLEPIAALYRDAGVPVQILESSPGRGNLVARLKGSGAKKPIVLLAHVDVVPIEGQPWTVPPFGVTEKDGFLWGRGINDDKSMAAANVALTLDLARTHAPLTRDILVVLTSGEETGGKAGAGWLTEKHKELFDGVALALNEGGGLLLTDDFAKPIVAGVQVSEKEFQSFQLVVKGKGGHSSHPPTTGDPVVALAHALVKVGDHRFPATVLPETKASFASQIPTAEPQYVAALKHVVASAPKVAPADEAVLAKDPAYNADIRTTCVTTMLKGSPQDNVLPTTAEATINCRILPGETIAQTHATLAKVIGDANVVITELPEFGRGPASPFEGEAVEAVKKVAAATFPGMPVVPSMSTGASDSRFLRGLGIPSYGVTPGSGTRAEGKAGHGAHGPDERKSVKWLLPGADYYRDIVRTLVL